MVVMYESPLLYVILIVIPAPPHIFVFRQASRGNTLCKAKRHGNSLHCLLTQQTLQPRNIRVLSAQVVCHNANNYLVSAILSFSYRNKRIRKIFNKSEVVNIRVESAFYIQAVDTTLTASKTTRTSFNKKPVAMFKQSSKRNVP